MHADRSAASFRDPNGFIFTRFPQGFVPAALSANALGEPAVYDAGSGALASRAAGARALNPRSSDSA